MKPRRKYPNLTALQMEQNKDTVEVHWVRIRLRMAEAARRRIDKEVSRETGNA